MCSNWRYCSPFNEIMITDKNFMEELWYKQHDYFENCVDKIYNYFHTYGYTWGDHMNCPTRKEIRETILELMENCLHQSSTGRIMVIRNKEENTFEVLLEL